MLVSGLLTRLSAIAFLDDFHSYSLRLKLCARCSSPTYLLVVYGSTISTVCMIEGVSAKTTTLEAFIDVLKGNGVIARELEVREITEVGQGRNCEKRP